MKLSTAMRRGAALLPEPFRGWYFSYTPAGKRCAACALGCALIGANWKGGFENEDEFLTRRFGCSEALLSDIIRVNDTEGREAAIAYVERKEREGREQ